VTSRLVRISQIRRWLAGIIHHGNMSLREGIVRKIFMAHDAEEVFNIRLPNLETKDIVSWHF
jgi:hypothetical protein